MAKHKVTIMDRWSGNALHTVTVEAAKETASEVLRGLAVVSLLANLSRANLSRADLSGANLSRADLSGANLSRADLSGADLRRADLSGADLSGANLSRADLSGANLSRADLSRANLSRANLSRADLSRADLSGANLSRADLSGANLSRANLGSAYLSGAYLGSADLSGADLSGADLSRANLSRANLGSAYLSGADLSGAYLSDLKTDTETRLPSFQIPQEGELIVFKKLSGGNIAKLRIPPEAARTATPIGRKCRAEFVEVLDGDGISSYDHRTAYKPGLVVRPDKYDPNPLVECSHGIHFFLTKEEAEAY
jgi:uncharacterized protein YjbI with pentapeptide repeats